MTGCTSVQTTSRIGTNITRAPRLGFSEETLTSGIGSLYTTWRPMEDNTPILHLDGP